MKKFYRFSSLMLIALNFMFFSSAQAQTVNNDTTFLYDNWPTIVPSNADVGKKFKDGQINPNYVPIGSVWNKRLLTYFFQNHTNDISVLAQRDAIREAFDLWAEQTGMAFIEVCNVNNADITILWAIRDHGDGNSFDGPGVELAHAFPPPTLGGLFAGDVHFDDEEIWTDQISTPGSDIDLVTVAAHEIGHSLGLHHTQVAGSLMLPNYTASHRYLGYDDVAGIRSLYGLPDQFIDGDNLVCSSCPYSVNIPLPAGTTVSWSTSRPSGLSITLFKTSTRKSCIGCEKVILYPPPPYKRDLQNG